MLWRCCKRGQRLNIPRKNAYAHALVARAWSSSVRTFANAATTTKDAELLNTDRTRNIGIIAHIDAGKTTTTERMLYYSGFTRRIGDVDEGSTVTDFLPAERARGITIQSAAITFTWPPAAVEQKQQTAYSPEAPKSSIPHNINLIDTPGHADFTFEVLRSLRVLDGAVCILDSVAGVEAQTEKVWTQASAYAIPRIIFVNKLDRDGAAFARTVKEVGAKLNVWPAVCAIPWWTADGRLQGIGDVVGLRGLRYAEGGDGKDIEVFDLQNLAGEDEALAAELKKARIALVELLSEHDDEMVEKYLETDEDHLAITSSDITASLRKCVLQRPQQITPIFAGASFRNVGVQPLLDAIVDLLPSPLERPDPEVSLDTHTKGSLESFISGSLIPQETTSSQKSSSKKLARKSKTTSFVGSLDNIEACALAFKVVSDAKRGMLVYVRVYSGTLSRHKAALWNTNLQNLERAPRLLRMYANDAVEIDSISAGQIGVIPGLKFARTGDTLVSYSGGNMNQKTGPPSPINSLQLRPIHVPPPVFFVSVEPNSLAEQKNIEDCLAILLREDPSLQVSLDEESGQTHLAGMGELHLEIARDRLIKDFHAKARIGQIEIGYRETFMESSGQVHQVIERDVGGKLSKAGCSLAIQPRSRLDAQDVEEAVHEHSIYEADLHDNNRLTVISSTILADGSPRPTGSEDETGRAEETSTGLPENLPIETVLKSLRIGVDAALSRGPTHGYACHSTHVTVTLDPSQDIFASTVSAAISSAARVAAQAALRKSSEISESVMMEPVMLATISVDEDSMGSVVHDISSARGGSVVELGADFGASGTDPDQSPKEVDVRRIYVPPDPFAGASGLAGGSDEALAAVIASSTRQIVARVPLKEMVGYLKHLRSLTAGRGTFTMAVDRFEKMSKQRQKAVINELRGGFE